MSGSPVRPGRPRRAVRRRVVVVLTVATSGAALLPALGASPAAAAPLTAPVYKVVQEGLTPEGGAQLARSARIGNALQEDGSFAFVDTARFGVVPSTAVGRGVDESQRPTVSQAVDFTALGKITTLSDAEAAERAKALLVPPAGYGATATVGHTTVDQSDARGKLLRSANLDTTVSYQLSLAGRPVVGPGAKLRASFGGDGSVLQLTQAVRTVEASDSVEIIDPEKAKAGCTALYGRGVEQNEPTLGYYAPALTASKASGKGTVQLLTPHYICQPVGVAEDSRLGGKLVPAAPSLSPSVTVKAGGDGRTVTAEASATGGTAPYRFAWSSSSATLDSTGQGARVQYAPNSRFKATEQLTATVTDANGVVTTATVQLPGAQGSASATGTPGGEGGALASNGIEQTVDEWQCAQDSANGYKSSMQSHGHTVSFDWRGVSAFEKDFRDTALGGWDATYVDNVDAQWYTGHGNSSGFTFKSSVDDTWITPADARWGNRDLEWLQLESCQVLRDTSGTNDYFARWAQAFQGLHLLNGFHTNATCVGGGTGRRFADYLFPATFLWWTTRPALTVQQAWASMANDLEPSGTRWRSISPATTGWVTNLGDHYWGQGSVGPDIAPGNASNPLIGFVAVSGVS
jgi:Family of unknown function (DUF6345)